MAGASESGHGGLHARAVGLDSSGLPFVRGPVAPEFDPIFVEDVTVRIQSGDPVDPGLGDVTQRLRILNHVIGVVPFRLSHDVVIHGHGYPVAHLLTTGHYELGHALGVALAVCTYAVAIMGTMSLLGAGVGALFGLTRDRGTMAHGLVQTAAGIGIAALAAVLLLETGPALM